MRFLCDVHIPIKVAKELSRSGFECGHVNQMPEKWKTPDQLISAKADAEDRILITKDSDFRISSMVKGSPRKLIKVNLGNISTERLIALLIDHLPELTKLNIKSRFIVEVYHDGLSVIELEP
jgi:predicted nuclease of predicted toxin-antitoxin system